MITKVIKLDINKNLYEKIKAKQGDTKSRFLLFQLLDGSMPFNLENRSVRAYMLKPDSTEVFNDLIINNRNTGHCTLELTNQVLAVAGIVKIELMIIENDKKITSSIFELQVDKSINSENSIVSTNEFNALLNGLASLSEYDNYKEKAKKVPELEENIQELGSQLDKNITDINKKINNISTSLTIRSVGIQLQNDSEMDYFINNFNDKLIKMKILGITDVILCPVIYNRNTRVDLAFTFDKLINCCNLVKNNRLKLTVKVHCWGDTFGETFDKILWFESYKNVLIRILNIGDIVRIGMMNETPFLTDNDNYKSNWETLCNYIKTNYPNVELISSPTTSSEYNVLNHFCDYICFNFYPNDNVNKPIQPLGALLEGVYNYTDFDIEGKYKNPNYNKKKIFITECGIQPYEYSHLYPWNWDTNPNQAYSEDVQYNFYSDIIGYCESTDWIIGLSWWISGASDNTWTFLNRKAENIIKEYWGGK